MLATNSIIYETLTTLELSNPSFQSSIISFLYKELGQYRDPEQDIMACLNYIMDPKKGGHVIVARNEERELIGVVLLARTNMQLFVPEYLLVYIATSEKVRGQGIGTQLLDFVRRTAKAPIALHVEHDNPAKRLYERVGFTSKYAEMRWYPNG